MEIVGFIYSLVIKFTKLCKWGELELIKLFIIPIIYVIKQTAETFCGVVFHFPEDDNGNEKANLEDEKRVLDKCKKYNSVIHLKVHNKNEFFARFVNNYSLGCGEAYMNGILDYCNSQDDLVEATKRFMETGIYRLYYNPWNSFLEWLELDAFNLHGQQKGYEIGQRYNLGNDLYEAMLDPYMQYSCGYWTRADNLNDAQLAKLELIAQKLKLKPGMRVLDLGCGWGMLSKYLAEKYDVQCVGVTVSKEQGEYGREKCKDLSIEINPIRRLN